MPKLRIFRSRTQRLRGLLGSEPTDDLVMLVPCHDVHTFGMAYPLDLAFVDKHAKVIQSYRNVEPGSRLRCVQAQAVIERAACEEKRWFKPRSFAGAQIQGALKERKES
ncbi:MAG: DUF192 domain-containing protein [Eggerthellaceae bacterium]|nr:DUF192 domain-containing protein [Eggerthellaceae bacterium]